MSTVENENLKSKLPDRKIDYARVKDDMKLPVLKDGSPFQIYTNQINWASTHPTFINWGEEAQILILASIHVINKARLLHYRSNAVHGEEFDSESKIPDGDFTVTTTVSVGNSNFLKKHQPEEWQAPDIVRTILTTVISMKANLWNINKHIDENDSIGFAEKIASTIFNKVYPDYRNSLLYLIGHWASTLYILSHAGITGLRPTRSVYLDDSVPELNVPESLRSHFNLFPAGTERTAAAVEGIKRMAVNKLSCLCPNVGNMVEIESLRQEVLKDRVKCHTRAEYLAGSRNLDFDDARAENYLGRLGTYLVKLYPENALAKSPYYNEAKVAGYPDYSPDWDERCCQYRHDVQLSRVHTSRDDFFEKVKNEMDEKSVHILKRIFVPPHKLHPHGHDAALHFPLPL